MIFRLFFNINFFLTLTSLKIIFVNCKSVSGMIKSPYFLRQLKLIYLAVLSANYWLRLRCTNFYLFLVLRFFFLIILVLFGISTHYPISDCFIGLKKTLEGSYIKVSEKSLCFERLRHFLLALFYLIFGFRLFLLVFIDKFLL